MNLMVLRRNYLLWKGRAFIAMHNIWTLISIFILGATSKSGAHHKRWGEGVAPKHIFLFFLPFDPEAFITCKNPIKLFNLCALSLCITAKNYHFFIRHPICLYIITKIVTLVFICYVIDPNINYFYMFF